MKTVEPADIDYISKIEFSEGFQHFHIHWPLKDLMETKRSVEFLTNVVCGDQSLALSWTLCTKKDRKDPTWMWFVARLRNSNRIIPIIYRVSLSSSGNVLFDGSGFSIVDGLDDHNYVGSVSKLDNFVNDGGLILSFWIDILKMVARGVKSRKRKLCASESTAGFFLDAAKMFSRVVGTESDASSDVTLIIIDKEENKIRRFHCHTIFLLARSSVFERMFASDKWIENCTKSDRSVKIDDISEEVMETVLRFIYTSDLPDMSTKREFLYDIIYAANKYNLDILKNWCVSRLIYNSSSKSLKKLVPHRYKQLVVADRHSLVQLKSVCLAQLSLCYLIGFPDHVSVQRSDLWSEIMQAVSERQANTTDIVLPEA